MNQAMNVPFIKQVNTIAHHFGIAATYFSRRSLAQMQRHIASGDIQRATACLERTIRWGVASAEVYTQHALLSVCTINLSEALRDYNHLIHLDPDYLLLCKRAAIHIALKQLAPAAHDIVAAINAASFFWTNLLYEMIRMLASYEQTLHLLSVWSKLNGDREKLATLIEELVAVEVDQAHLAWFLAEFPKEEEENDK